MDSQILAIYEKILIKFQSYLVIIILLSRESILKN